MSKCRCSLVIDAIIEIVQCEFVSDAGEVNDHVALLEQGRPVERLRQIGKLDADDVGAIEQGSRSRGGDDRVAALGQKRHKMTANETVSPGYQHSAFVAHHERYFEGRVFGNLSLKGSR